MQNIFDLNKDLFQGQEATALKTKLAIFAKEKTFATVRCTRTQTKPFKWNACCRCFAQKSHNPVNKMFSAHQSYSLYFITLNLITFITLNPILFITLNPILFITLNPILFITLNPILLP
jgi:hypothetical protein